MILLIDILCRSLNTMGLWTIKNYYYLLLLYYMEIVLLLLPLSSVLQANSRKQCHYHHHSNDIEWPEWKKRALTLKSFYTNTNIMEN